MDTQNKALFKSPEFSYYPLKHSNKFSTAIGNVTPVLCRETAPSERISLGATQLTRFGAMFAPVMDSFQIALDYHFVPARILKSNVKYGIDYEAFHNPSTTDRPAYPKESLIKLYLAACEASVNGDACGTLYDYLNLPTFESFDKALKAAKFNFTDITEEIEYSLTPADYINLLFNHNVSAAEFPVIGFTFADTLNWFSVDFSVTPVVSDSYDSGAAGFVNEDTNEKTAFNPALFALRYGHSPYMSSDDYTDIIVDFRNTYSDFDSFLKAKGLTASQFWNKYFIYLKQFIASEFLSPDIKINVTPFLAYWRIIYDWYINTNVDGDGDELFKLVDPTKPEYQKLFDRRYPNDIFTSAFSSTQQGSAVPIPANGTIPDLRSANQLQKFKERVLYAGKRYIDNILVIFGQKSSNARFDRTEVLKREVSYAQIEAVTQTNQADISQLLESPVGSLSGQGISYKNFARSFDFTAEEHGFLFAFYSIRPQASYFQGIPRYFLKTDYFDFLVPGFDSIGEQDVKSVELYLDPTQGIVSVDANKVPNEIFGYNRRYYEYTHINDEIHGTFRNSEDFWTAARSFTSKPTLSSQFIGVNNETSNYNRIFALTDNDEQNIKCVISFAGGVVTPISKYVDYDL